MTTPIREIVAKTLYDSLDAYAAKWENAGPLVHKAFTRRADAVLEVLQVNDENLLSVLSHMRDRTEIDSPNRRRWNSAIGAIRAAQHRPTDNVKKPKPVEPKKLTVAEICAGLRAGAVLEYEDGSQWLKFPRQDLEFWQRQSIPRLNYRLVSPFDGSDPSDARVAPPDELTIQDVIDHMEAGGKVEFHIRGDMWMPTLTSLDDWRKRKSFNNRLKYRLVPLNKTSKPVDPPTPHEADTWPTIAVSEGAGVYVQNVRNPVIVRPFDENGNITSAT